MKVLTGFSWLLLAIFILFSSTAAFSNPTPNEVNEKQSAGATTISVSGGLAVESIQNGGKTFYSTKHPFEVYLTVLVSVLLVVLVGVLTAFYWKHGGSDDFQRALLLITVIFCALMLIVAGYTDEQTAPVFSLLGAIVGYIFGRGPTKSKNSDSEKTESEDKQKKKREHQSEVVPGE